MRRNHCFMQSLEWNSSYCSCWLVIGLAVISSLHWFFIPCDHRITISLSRPCCFFVSTTEHCLVSFK
ncbi:hypothetical protein CapIbe_002928 [Capra ibex]